METFLTADDAAAELRCSKAQIYKLINGHVKGITPLPHLVLGPRKKLIPRSELEAWKQRNIAGKILPDSESGTVDMFA